MNKDTEYNKEIMNLIKLHSIDYSCEFEKDPKLSGKSLLLKSKDGFNIFTIRGDRKSDNKKIRSILKSQKLRFATNDELYQVAGVVSGCLPPFGKPLIDVDHFMDEELLKNEFISFNAAMPDKKVRLKMEDYLKLANPSICEFKKV
jgi:Ala-tRNA(Pro) deacylase